MCENKKIFNFALDLIKDTLVVLLNNRNELAHFWFHETLFKPFEIILMSGKISDLDQDQASLEIIPISAQLTLLLFSRPNTPIHALRVCLSKP